MSGTIRYMKEERLKDKIIRKTGRASTHQKYVTSYGQVVPGGSTIANLVNFGGCDGLIGWGVRLDREGVDYKQARDEAADFGKCFHRAVEQRWRGEPFDSENYPGAYVAPSLEMSNNFFALLEELGLVMVGSEEQGVSDKEEWGGTMDLILARKEEPSKPIILGDLKSSNSLSATHIIQVGGAYGVLFEEKYGYPPERVILFRADRNPPHDVTQHTIRGQKLEAAREAARLLRGLWRLKPILNGRI